MLALTGHFYCTVQRVTGIQVSSKQFEGPLLLKQFQRVNVVLGGGGEEGVVILWRKRMGGDGSIWRPLLQ